MQLTSHAWLKHLDRARRSALSGDAEGVHQVRVAARRLSVWLKLGKQKRLRPELRWLCQTLALCRDLDVFGVALKEEVLSQLRPAARAQARRALLSKRYASLRRALEQVPAPGKVRWKVLRRLKRRVRKLGRADPLAEGKRLHRYRRALRALRYARDWLGMNSDALAAQQQHLGAVCDLFALEAFTRRLGARIPPQLQLGIERALELLDRAPVDLT